MYIDTDDLDIPKVVRFSERTQTVRKPRRLSCGGQAQPGWHITVQPYLLDGEFHADEICQLCHWAEFGAEVPAGLHGNADLLRGLC